MKDVSMNLHVSIIEDPLKKAGVCVEPCCAAEGAGALVGAVGVQDQIEIDLVWPAREPGETAGRELRGRQVGGV